MKLRIDTSRSYALALEGGGAKGAYQIGAWKALREAGVKIDAVAGTSVGALNGSLIVMGDLEKAENIWENIRYSQVMDVDDETMSRLLKGGVKLDELDSVAQQMFEVIKNRGFDVTPLRKWISQVVDEKTVRESPVELFIDTFSLSDGKLLELRAKDLPEGTLCDMLLASAYLPVFRSEKLGGKRYADGGLRDVLPLHVLIEHGYKDILALRLFGIGVERSVKIPEDTRVYTVEPTADLGSTLEFEPAQSRENLRAGYYDMQRFLYGLRGTKYYVDCDWDETKALSLLSDAASAGESVSLRTLCEKQLPALAKRLDAEKGDYIDLAVALVEAAAEHKGVDPWQIVTADALLELAGGGAALAAAFAEPAARKLARERMDEAVQGIQSALNWRGVSLWPGGEPDVLVTAYAADFLLTMRESGAALPGGLLAEVFGALENALDRVPDSLEEGRAQAYGLWVLTREGRITTQAMEQLVSQLEDRFPEWRKDVASTLLAGSCAIMRMNDDARHLIALYQAPGPDFQARGYLDALGVQALRASVLARHFPDMLDTQRTELAQELLDVLNGGRYVTLSASLGVRALLDMGGAANMPSGISLRCTSMQPGFEPVESAPADLGGMLTLSAPGCAAYALDMPAGSQPLYWEVSAQGFDRKPPSEALAQGLEVSREYLDAEGRPVTTVKQGDVVTVSISARSHGGSVSDAVIVDLLPGGFEMVLNSDIKGQNPSGEPGYKSVDRREDRMIVFSDLAVEPFVFTYKIRAVNKGVYTLPPVQAEAMYNRSLQAHSAGGGMVVE